MFVFTHFTDQIICPDLHNTAVTISPAYHRIKNFAAIYWHIKNEIIDHQQRNYQCMIKKKTKAYE